MTTVVVPAAGSGNTSAEPLVAAPAKAKKESTEGVHRSAYNFCCEINPEVIPRLDEVIAYFKKFEPNYILVGSHIGSSQGLHYHLYAQYPKKRHLTFGKRTTCGAHCETSYGSAQANVKYIRCQDEKHLEEGVTYGGDYLEEGVMRLNGGFHDMRAADVADMTYEEMCDLTPMQFLMASKVKKEMKQLKADNAFVDELRQLKENGPSWRPAREVIYVTGPSDAGKTTGAEWKEVSDDKCPIENMGKLSFDKNGFGHTHNVNENTKVLFVEEFRDSMMDLNKFLEFTDKGVTSINIKGGDISLNSVERIYLCSLKPLSTLYRKSCVEYESRHQIYKRISKYYYVDKDHVWHDVEQMRDDVERDRLFTLFDYKYV